MSSTEAPRPPGSAPWPSGVIKLSMGVVLAALLALSALAWVLTVRRSGEMDVPGLPRLLQPAHAGMEGMEGMEGMGATAMGTSLFIGMWVVMMVAMMFPSVAPMVVYFTRISARRGQGPLAVPLFVGSYLVIWTLMGAAVYAAYRLALGAAPGLSARAAAVAAGAMLAAAGAYQLTRYKSVCLRHCRGPLEFVLGFKPGLKGAVRMGGEHGLFCLGCCWGLMVVLFVLGLMNLAWMGAIAAVIFVEKVAPFGEAMARGVGVALIGLGAAVALWPALFAGRVIG